MANVFCTCPGMMKIERNGVRRIDYDEFDRPYAIYHTDRYYCPICGQRVCIGAVKPILTRGMEGFEAEVAEILSEE